MKSIDAGATWEAASLGEIATAVTALAIDPVTPRTLYAGTSGIFKTTDAGATWEAANVGLTSLWVTALAIDPVTPRTLYAGTFGSGVFKSTDAGANWQAENAGLSDTKVLDLAIDPLTPSTLHAGTTDGVFSIQQQADVCIGNCHATHTVAINDVVTLVNIALGTAPPGACPDGAFRWVARSTSPS